MQSRTIDSTLKREGVDTLKEGIQSIKESVSDGAAQVASDIQQAGSSAYYQAKEAGERGAAELKRHVQNEPMKAMLFGACAGFALGYLIRR